VEGELKFEERILLLPSERMNENYPLFADLLTAAYPAPHDGVTLIFTSFQPKRYHEIKKVGSIMIMPTWNKPEIDEYIYSQPFKQDHNFNADQMKRIEEAVKMLGGVMRRCIRCGKGEENANDILGTALTSKGLEVCKRYFEAGFGGDDTIISDVLIHRNPQINSEGKYMYNYTNCEFQFASKYVMDKIFKMDEDTFRIGAAKKFRNGNYGGAADGKLFESLCLHTFPFSGELFTLEPLLNGSGLNSITLRIPPKENLRKPLPVPLQPDVLYLPSEDNFESADTFCVMDVDKVRTLIIIQVTIGPTHDVKANGIEKIYNFYNFDNNGTIHNTIDNTIIVFMTPKNGRLNSKQNITVNKKKDVSKCISAAMINQYKLENILILEPHLEKNYMK
jgi:hypothetical protein